MSNDIRALEDRYKSDADFHQLVTGLAQLIENLRMSPSEVREAAMFACYLVELRNPMPIPTYLQRKEPDHDRG